MKTASACLAVLRQLRSIRRSVPNCFPAACCVTCPHASGLRQRDTGRHSATSHSSAAIGHVRRRAVDPLGLKVPTCHTAPVSVSLAEGPGGWAFKLQTRRPGVPSAARDGAAVPCRRIRPTSRLRSSKTFTFRLVIAAGSAKDALSNRRRSSISGRGRSSLELAATARHLRDFIASLQVATENLSFFSFLSLVYRCKVPAQ